MPATPRATVKVIDDGANQDQPKTLIEASRLAKARKADSAPAVHEINDENLHEYAEGAQVIVMETEPSFPAPGSAAADQAAAERAASRPPGDSDQVYWRNRGLEIRRSWRDALDELEGLELEAAALRQRFYAEDDPYVRDARIKPSWDRALDRIRELKNDTERYEQALTTYLDEGRKADVPPGWLAEGWELEPSAEERTSARVAERPEVQDDDVIAVDEAIEVPVLETPAADVSTEGGGGR